MNFGGNKPGAGASVQALGQMATYHISPNFTTPPPPSGPLNLGTVVEDLKVFYPLGTERVAVPAAEVYRDEKRGVATTVTRSSTAEAGAQAHVVIESVGADASFKRGRSTEDVYKVDRLETVFFHPRPGYLAQVMRLADVQGFFEFSGRDYPVYLVTGLKVAWGATVALSRQRENEVGAGIGAAVPAGVVDAEMGVNVGVARASGSSAEWSEPCDFVIGIQVLKLYYRRKLFSGEKVLRKKLAMPAGGLLDVADDNLREDVPVDYVEEEEGEEGGFTVGVLDESDMKDSTGVIEVREERRQD